ncbi:TetR family transcriptional regulator [Halopseudomonas sp.]|uniref:TetR family transcriptional regulator n=1 Tax=Halopseudomonas sp. TaxID=2901191 RepID=UPI0039E33B8D
MVRRTKEEAQETRNQILSAAELCFYRKGLSRTSLAEIASAAGVTRGAIYWHFADKSELVGALLERINIPLQPLSEASRSPSEPDPLGRLRDLLVTVFRRAATDPEVRRVSEILFHKCEYTEDLGNLRQWMQDFRREYNHNIELSLGNAVAKGQLPEKLDLVVASRCVHAFITGVLDQWLLVPVGLDLDAKAETLADGILDMLRLSPALQKT